MTTSCFVGLDDFSLAVIQKYCIWVSNVPAKAGYFPKYKPSSGAASDETVTTLNNQLNPALHADNVADSCKS